MGARVIRITVRVKPNAKVTAVEKGPGGEYVVRVKARPVDGKANEAVISPTTGRILSGPRYNGIVLLTGEVPDEAARDAMATLARSTDRVRGVQNELQVTPPAPLAERTSDAYLTSVVKTRFLEANDKFSATHVKVVTDRSVVHLMGIVKRTEADAAAAIAASTKGVARVVKVFEYLD